MYCFTLSGWQIQRYRTVSYSTIQNRINHIYVRYLTSSHEIWACRRPLPYYVLYRTGTVLIMTESRQGMWSSASGLCPLAKNNRQFRCASRSPSNWHDTVSIWPPSFGARMNNFSLHPILVISGAEELRSFILGFDSASGGVVAKDGDEECPPKLFKICNIEE